MTQVDTGKGIPKTWIRLFRTETDYLFDSALRSQTNVNTRRLAYVIGGDTIELASLVARAGKRMRLAISTKSQTPSLPRRHYKDERGFAENPGLRSSRCGMVWYGGRER